MASQRTLVVSTLKHLARNCLREQMKLKVIRATRRQIQNDEVATLARIKGIKARIDRELVTSATVLGIQLPPDDT